MPIKKYTTIEQKKEGQRKARKKYRDNHKKEIKERAKTKRRIVKIALAEYYDSRKIPQPKGGPKKGRKKFKKILENRKKILEGKLKFKNTAEDVKPKIFEDIEPEKQVQHKRYRELEDLDAILAKLKTIEKKIDN